MKKIVIGALVGAIILFIYQFVSWNASGLHQNEQLYTPKQDAIMQFLQTQDLPEGGYLLPNLTPGTTMAEAQKAEAAWSGKPWYHLQYHKAMNTNMGLNIVRSLVVDFIVVALLAWLLLQLRRRSLANAVKAAVAVGVISFLVEPYTYYIWYSGFDIWGSLADGIIPWLLIGSWLGWYLRDKTVDEVSTSQRQQVYA